MLTEKNSDDAIERYDTAHTERITRYERRLDAILRADQRHRLEKRWEKFRDSI